MISENARLKQQNAALQRQISDALSMNSKGGGTDTESSAMTATEHETAHIRLLNTLPTMNLGKGKKGPMNKRLVAGADGDYPSVNSAESDATTRSRMTS